MEYSSFAKVDMDQYISSQEEMEVTLELGQLFLSEEEMQEPEEQVQVPFKCLHDREEFSELDEFIAHNKQVHKKLKRKCKACHNVFRDKKHIKAHVKFHENEEFACIHDGRSFAKVNGFQLHNNDCHKKFKQVCPHSKCCNVFNGDRDLQVHLVQQHPVGRLCHKKPPKQHH